MKLTIGLDGDNLRFQNNIQIMNYLKNHPEYTEIYLNLSFDEIKSLLTDVSKHYLWTDRTYYSVNKSYNQIIMEELQTLGIQGFF